MILILDFGSQYTQLIARKIRGLHIFAEIAPYHLSLREIREKNPKGIILSGGPASVLEKGAPTIAPGILELGIPILGICYGMQLLTKLSGGRVKRSSTREYGRADIHASDQSDLFHGLPACSTVWMSHGDSVGAPPPGFERIAHSGDCPVAAMRDPGRSIFGVQFHPEVHHTPHGVKILRNFAKRICRHKSDWRMSDFVERTTRELRERIGKKRILCGVSGGVDSTVLAVLLHRAVGSRLKSVFVDNGLLREGEARTVIDRFRKIGIPVKFVQASKQFLNPLKGVKNPERKRRIIGRVFIDVFFRELKKTDLLAQGTLYPDVIESVSVRGPSATIKTHHNRVKEVLRLEKQNRLVEPLKNLFKDEVREVGKELELPEEVLLRQPFPGPGLGVRILGAVTPERLSVLRKADVILLEEIKSAGLYHKIWQTFCVLLPIRSVGVMGDERTYDNAVAIRAVKSMDGMTADWVRIPHKILSRISGRIINEVAGINRVVYDISTKPPSTIEWE